MSKAQNGAKLAFGVEIELLLKPKGKFVSDLDKIYQSKRLARFAPKPENWAKSFEAVKEAQRASQDPALEKSEYEKRMAKHNAEKFRESFRELCANNLTAEGHIPAALKSSDFTQWSIVDEVKLDEVEGYCRVEFVSRAIASDDNWQVEFDRLYEFLDSNCHIKVTKGCSTHVHVSPSAKPRGQGQGQDDKWTYSDLRSIMKAISYYDDPITKVMPADRKQNPFAKSNMKVEPPSKYYPDVSTKSWKPLFKYYDDALPKDISTRRAHATMGGDRRVSWNFEHITENCGTIEFRRCPGCDTADEAKRWVIFTLGFLCQARANGKDIDWGVNWCVYQDLKKHPSVKDLGFFVNNGAERLWDPANRRALGRIVEDTSKATVFPAEEIRKMKQLEDGKSPFAESVRRTPPGTPVARSPANSPANSRPGTPSTSTGISSSRPGTPTTRTPAQRTGGTPKNNSPVRSRPR